MSSGKEEEILLALRLRDGTKASFSSRSRQLDLPEQEWQSAAERGAIVSAELDAERGMAADTVITF